MKPSSPASASSTSPLADRSFVAALVIAVVVALGFGLVVPVLPLFARDFGVSLFAVTGVVSAFAGVRLVSNLYTGVLTDRFGARNAIGWGALIVALSSLLVSVAPNFWALLLFRGFGGFGSALFFNAMLTLAVSSVSSASRGRAVGMLQGAFLFGIAIGPAVGGVLAAPLGLRWPFVIYAACCAAAGVVAFALLPDADTDGRQEVESAVGPDEEPVAAEPVNPRHARETPRGLSQLLAVTRDFCRNPTFVAALVMMAASRWAATGVRFSLVPVFGDEVVGAGAAVIGFALTLAALTHFAVLWPAGRIADTYGRRVLGAPAYFVFAIIAAGLAFADTVPTFLLALALYGIGTGLTSVTPPAIVGDIASPERTGVAVGVLNTAGDLGSVLGPLVSGLLADQLGYGWGFGASAGLLAVGGLAALRMRETLSRD